VGGMVPNNTLQERSVPKNAPLQVWHLECCSQGGRDSRWLLGDFGVVFVKVVISCVLRLHMVNV
jgi:hypothetical protein